MAIQSGNLIQQISDDQLMGIRNILESNMAEGRGSRRMALDMVGRIDRTTGRRTGGLIGNHSRDMAAIDNARKYLETGDNAYFRLTSRDKRFDSTIAKAFKESGGVSADKASKIIGRYSDTLLRKRGEKIARTETRRATHAGSDEAMNQVVDTGYVRSEQVRKIWHDTPDKRTRDSHRNLGGESIALSEFFISSRTGAKMGYPGDTSQGASGVDVIHCRCWLEHRIDYLSNL